MPLTKRVTLDKAQPLPRPQFPHCTVRPFPQPQPRLCTRLPPPDLHTALGIAQRNTGDAHTHTHTGPHTGLHVCLQAHAPSGTHVHTSGHTTTLIRVYTSTPQAHPTLPLRPPRRVQVLPTRPLPLPTAPTPAHTHAHSHTHPPNRLCTNCWRGRGWEREGKKPTTQPGKRGAGVRGRGK